MSIRAIHVADTLKLGSVYPQQVLEAHVRVCAILVPNVGAGGLVSNRW